MTKSVSFAFSANICALARTRYPRFRLVKLVNGAL